MYFLNIYIYGNLQVNFLPDINSDLPKITLEIPPLGIYRIYLDDVNSISVFPWMQPDEHWKSQSKIFESISGLKICWSEIVVEPSWLVPNTSSKVSILELNIKIYLFVFSFHLICMT